MAAGGRAGGGGGQLKTTKKHFEEFKKYHREYLERYGLFQWRFEYKHERLEDCYAESELNFTGKTASVTLATAWTKTRPLNSEELRRLAKHEVNHALLHSLYWHAKVRFIQPDALEEAEEAIVRRLDRLIPD